MGLLNGTLLKQVYCASTLPSCRPSTQAYAEVLSRGKDTLLLCYDKGVLVVFPLSFHGKENEIYCYNEMRNAKM